MRRGDVEPQLLHEPRQTRRLAFGQVEHQARERRRVDDRMLERAFQTSTDQPRVKCVVAVLDKHRALREAEERAARVLEFRRTDEHRAVDVMALARVRVDRGAAIDQRVEERQRPLEGESLGADLEDEERRIACGFDVERDELRILELRPVAYLRGVDRDLLPGNELGRPSRLEEELTLG